MIKTDLNLKGLSLLIADANLHFQGLVKGMLQGFGAKRVEMATNGNIVLGRTRSELVDLLICDCYLPGMDGFDLVRTIRHEENNPNRFTPIIVLTSHTQTHNVERARDCGANLVLAKPVSPKLLYERLLWVAEDPRPFVIGADYVGPDRRFRIDFRSDRADRRSKPDQDQNAETAAAVAI